MKFIFSIPTLPLGNINLRYKLNLEDSPMERFKNTVCLKFSLLIGKPGNFKFLDLFYLIIFISL